IRDFHVTGVQTCALPIYPLPTAHEKAPGLAAGGSASSSASELLRELLVLHAVRLGRGVAEALAAVGFVLGVVAFEEHHARIILRSEERRVGTEAAYTTAR